MKIITRKKRYLVFCKKEVLTVRHAKFCKFEQVISLPISIYDIYNIFEPLTYNTNTPPSDVNNIFTNAFTI